MTGVVFPRFSFHVMYDRDMSSHDTYNLISALFSSWGPSSKGIDLPRIKGDYNVENGCKSHVILEQSGDNYFEILE